MTIKINTENMAFKCPYRDEATAEDDRIALVAELRVIFDTICADIELTNMLSNKISDSNGENAGSWTLD